MDAPTDTPAVEPVEPAVEFGPVDAAFVDRALRSLDWELRFTGFRMGPSTGNERVTFYSLGDAVVFLLKTTWDRPMLADNAKKSAINSLDLGAFTTWVGDVVGDTELADAMEARIDADAPYSEQVGALESVLVPRLEQYRAVKQSEQEEPATP